MTEHTPTPWSILVDENKNPTQVEGSGGQVVADCLMGYGTADDANAAFIVKAVNNHVDLLRALTEMVQAFEPFTSKPMGAPGSDARNQQQLQIAAHRNAREALARLIDPVGGAVRQGERS